MKPRGGGSKREEGGGGTSRRKDEARTLASLDEHGGGGKGGRGRRHKLQQGWRKSVGKKLAEAFAHLLSAVAIENVPERRTQEIP